MLHKSYKVTIVEADFYASQAINSYLAWDRRTRIKQRLYTLGELFTYLENIPITEQPDTILLDGSLLHNPEDALAIVQRVGDLSNAHILVLAHEPNPLIAQAVQQGGARGYVLRGEVALQISWLIVWARDFKFVVTAGAADIFPDAAILPEAREYPELTDRVRQAIILCVVEGMSAELAADEMGLSPHTIRTYIKEGYSILEAASHEEFPIDLSPQEKAFMRFTALERTQTGKSKKG